MPLNCCCTKYFSGIRREVVFDYKESKKKTRAISKISDTIISNKNFKKLREITIIVSTIR